MINISTAQTWATSGLHLGRLLIAIALGLTLISLPGCGDDDHHDGDGHAPVDHEQIDEHMDGHDAAPMDSDSTHDHRDADNH